MGTNRIEINALCAFSGPGTDDGQALMSRALGDGVGYYVVL